MLSDENQQFQELLAALREWKIEDFSGETRVRSWTDQAASAITESVSTYRRFIHGKYELAQKHDKAICNDRQVPEPEQQFVQTRC